MKPPWGSYSLSGLESKGPAFNFGPPDCTALEASDADVLQKRKGMGETELVTRMGR